MKLVVTLSLVTTCSCNSDGAGLIREAISQRDLYFMGEGDLVTTGYDGDFVFGGTQFNTMGVAASVDVIFETFGRILFEEGA